MITNGRHPYIPPMSGEQAYLLALILEEMVTAIWGAHGDAMADFQGRAFPDAPSPPGSVTDFHLPENDCDNPF